MMEIKKVNFQNLYKRVLEVKGMALVEVTPEQKRGLESALSLTSTGKGKIHNLCLYKEHRDKDKLYIPRSIVKEVITDSHWEKINYNFKGNLKPEQSILSNQYLEAVKNNYGGIIKAPTGGGKTVTALDIINKIGLKTLIIVPTDRIMTQWISQLKKFLNLEASDIGIIRGSRCDVKDKKVVVAMIHTLAQRYSLYPKHAIFDIFGLVVFDEIQVLGAETFSRTAGMFNCKYRLGLSATPRRKDGCENVFKYHIGNVVSEYNKIHVKPNVIMIPVNMPESCDRGCVWGGDLMLGRYFNRLAKAPNRNKLIADWINKAYVKGRKILVLSDRLNQLDSLRDLLAEIPNNNIGFFTNKKKEPNKQIILGTYGSAGLGADIPNINTIVYATPRADVEQPSGRILGYRATTDKLPLIIDFVDMQSGIIRKWAGSRMRFYRGIADKIQCNFSF